MSFLRRRGGAGGTRTLRIGRVVGLAFRTWFRRFLAIHIVAVVCFLPALAAAGGRSRRTDSLTLGVSGAWASGWYLASRHPDRWFRERSAHCLLGYATQFGITVVVIRLAYRSLGRPARGTVLGLTRLIPFAVGNLAVFVALDSLVTGWRGDDEFLGILLMTCVEIALGVAFVLAVPAAADGHGLLDALERSRKLGRGSRMKIAVLIVVPAVLKRAPVFVLGIREPFPTYTVVFGLFGTFEACLLAVAYRELAAMREGPRPDELGRIFA